MKILTAAMAMAAMMGMTGAAMACGGAGGGKLAKVKIAKSYRTPQIAARNATAYAVNKVLQSQSGGQASLVKGSNMRNAQLVSQTKTSEQFKIKFNLRNDSGTGAARVAVKKTATGWQPTILSGHVSASW